MAKHNYRIDLHGPYQRSILVRDGVDLKSFATRAEAQEAMVDMIARDGAPAFPMMPSQRGGFTASAKRVRT